MEPGPGAARTHHPRCCPRRRGGRRECCLLLPRWALSVAGARRLRTPGPLRSTRGHARLRRVLRSCSPAVLRSLPAGARKGWTGQTGTSGPGRKHHHGYLCTVSGAAGGEQCEDTPGGLVRCGPSVLLPAQDPPGGHSRGESGPGARGERHGQRRDHRAHCVQRGEDTVISASRSGPDHGDGEAFDDCGGPHRGGGSAR